MKKLDSLYKKKPKTGNERVFFLISDYLLHCLLFLFYSFNRTSSLFNNSKHTLLMQRITRSKLWDTIIYLLWRCNVLGLVTPLVPRVYLYVSTSANTAFQVFKQYMKAEKNIHSVDGY